MESSDFFLGSFLNRNLVYDSAKSRSEIVTTIDSDTKILTTCDEISWPAIDDNLSSVVVARFLFFDDDLVFARCHETCKDEDIVDWLILTISLFHTI